MSALFYFDTCLWIDYYEKRGIAGDLALKRILHILSNNQTILYSDLIIKELKHLHYSSEEIMRLLATVKPNLRRVHIFKEQIEHASVLTQQRKIPKGDCLHAILARDNEAILLSRDKDFEKLKDIVIVKRPHELT